MKSYLLRILTSITGFGMLATSLTAAPASMSDFARGENFYLAVSAGYASASDSDFTVKDSTGATTATGNFEWDDGYDVTVALGYAWGQMRAELEYAYREIDSKSFTSTVGGTSFTDSLDANVVTLNLLWDVPVHEQFFWYIGGGLGAADFDDDTVFAWQFRTGLNYPLNEKFLFGLGYRLFGAADVETESGGLTGEFEIPLTHHFEASIIMMF